MTVRETRTRFDELLARFIGKSVLDFNVDSCPLLWAITYKAIELETIEQVEDLVLGSLVGFDTFCGNDPCMASYPNGYTIEEILRWELANGEDKPYLLSEFLNLRIGTPTTYALVAAIALRSTRESSITICYTSPTNLVKPNHTWLRLDDRTIDLASRSKGKRLPSTLKPDREIGLK